ncbi:MAG: replication-associated recombination protein A [Sporichthyaceae bacterium]|nr:replication-associated recombination protein A [Sporichthyaceae bacterium]
MTDGRPSARKQRESLFDDAERAAAQAAAPLAVKMRPRTLDEVVGQDRLLVAGSPLHRLVEGKDGHLPPSSVILWGPPGSGKTTLAYLVSQATDREFVELSAVNAGVKDVREVMERARRELAMTGRETVLFLDEVHRFSKAQQDSLLPGVENRVVTLIAATTENPYFTIISPLLSRSLMLTLEALDETAIRTVLDRAIADQRGLGDRVTVSPDAIDHIVRLGAGDARRALTVLEAAAGAATSLGRDEVDLATVEQAMDRAAIRYDREGDQHYDVTSALIKSVRGSDVDAALHYLARMVEAGEDPRFIARRLVILASEDIGLADPSALQTAIAAFHAVAFIGLPEAGITLAHAVIALSLAPKSNAVIKALGAALGDVKAGLAGPVPMELRDASYSAAGRLGHGKGYVYPHDQPGGITAARYAPEAVRNREYYQPTRHGAEARYADLVERIRAALRGDEPGE